jgi:RNA polymerase sigma-70 factor (ECF subfamily)
VRTGRPEADEAQVQATLLALRAKFLRFVERRVGSAAIAEEIVQGAFVRALEAGPPDGDGAVAWFYRVLRNAIVDRARRQAVEARAIERHAESTAADPELRAAVCECIGGVLPTLRPDYADIVRQVDLEERPVAEVARAIGITPNNAAVRLHRARQALRGQLQRACGACAEHACLDCSCRGARAALEYVPKP